MPGRLFLIQIIFLIFFLNGCTPGTRSQLVENGQYPLSAEELFTIVADNSLHLEAINFNATLFFKKNGTLAAIDHLKNTDTGKWDISSDKELCLKFRVWYYGDTKCYSVFRDQRPNSFSFFTKNGARYYSAEYIPADPHDLAKQLHKTETKQFLRKDLARKIQTDTGSGSIKSSSPLPAASPSLIKTQETPDIARLARDCPDCNLAGVNLSKAHLIGANLAGANLSGADLSGANLRRADLTGANLSGTKCITTNFAGAVLINTNLSDADFTGSNLIKANLNGATTTGTIFTGAHLEGIEGFK